MIEFTRSVVAAAPPSAVWALLTDFERASEWLPFAQRVVAVSGEGLGAQYTMEVRLGGQDVAVENVVTEYEPGRLIAFRAVVGGVKDPAGLYTSENCYSVEPLGTGARITVRTLRPDEGGIARRAALKAATHAEGEVARRALLKLAYLAAVELHNDGSNDGDTEDAHHRAVSSEGLSPPESIPPAPAVQGIRPAEKRDGLAGVSPDTEDEALAAREPLTTEMAAGIGQRTVSPSLESRPRGALNAPNESFQAVGVTITEDEARSLLTTWASSKRLVDDKLFSGRLQVENNPRVACVVVRLLETRAEQEVYVSASKGLPALPRYNVGIDAIEVAEPTDFAGSSWRFILEGSERPAPCPSGCMSGRQQCRRCQGGSVRCWGCSGRGQNQKTEYVNGQSLSASSGAGFAPEAVGSPVTPAEGPVGSNVRPAKARGLSSGSYVAI